MKITQWIKAVAYYRMSSDRQETSIADQRTAVQQYAAKHGYKIVREYLDEGISGWKSEERKGFQRLIADATGGDFEVILCWDQDRFSRFDPIEASHYFYLLRKAGVKIVTLAQGELDFNAEFGWLTASITQHAKAQYVKTLARDSTRGLRAAKLTGRWIGPVPYGYRLAANGRLEFAEPEAVAVVQRIFHERMSGFGGHTIAKRLTGDGVPTPWKGETWSASLVRHMLQRDAYIGNTVIGKNPTARYSKVVDEPVTLPDTHPPIIDRQTWDTVQGMRKTRQRVHSEGAPLSGLVRCGRCGAPMYTTSRQQYLCGTYHSGGKCGYCVVKQQPLLAAVARKLRQRLLLESPGRLEAAIQRKLDKRGDAQQSSVEPTRRKIAMLDRKIERAASRLLAVDDSVVADVEAQLVALKREREQLAENLDSRPSRPLPSAKTIAARMWELDRDLREAAPAKVRHALAQWIDHIRLDFQPVTTNRGQSYRFTGGSIQLCQNGKSSPRSV